MRFPRAALAWIAALCCLTPLTIDAQITTPEEHLGRPVGTDFQLADWDQVSSYFRVLGNASPRVRVRNVGTTTEGRDFLIAVISSERNLARLDELKAISRRLADPRGVGDAQREKDLAEGKVFLFISSQMHSTEIAASEMSMELAHLLATSDEEPWSTARRNVVVILAPCLNPDGLDHVVEWYRRIVGTPFESAGLPKLYQLYAGHDNNRDWFMLSLKESRIVTGLLYREFFPQVYWDVHQQGRSAERLFVPPFRDPLNPNCDAAIVSALGALGSRAMLDMTGEGYTGVASGVTYDMWWNGGNRSVPVRHNIIGILSEAASANFASPVFLPRSSLRAPRGIETGYAPSNRFPKPWPGGWWRIRDIIDYEIALGRSFLGSLAREPRTWLAVTNGAARRIVDDLDAPVAWVVPTPSRDPGALRRMVDVLLAGGIEIERATAPFVADGRTHEANTLVLWRAQPYGRFLRDLFEVQRYPDGPAPYDVSGWTMPLLFGLERAEVVRPFEVSSVPVTDAADAVVAEQNTDPEAPFPHFDPSDSDGWRAVIRLLSDGIPVSHAGHPQSARPGAWVLSSEPHHQSKIQGTLGALRSAVRGRNVRTDPSEARILRTVAEMPRIGLYAPWSSSMNEGWTRWFFDHFELPYRRIRNETIRAGDLASILDVLVLPSLSSNALRDGRAPGSVFPELAGGLDPEGSVAIQEFVRAGGTLVTLGRSSDYAIELFSLPLENVATGTGDDAFSCPGSILRTEPVGRSAWVHGLPASQSIFFSRSRAYRLKDEKGAGGDVDTLLRLPEKQILLSGWIRKPETIAGASVWLRAVEGEGQIHLFSFRPQYRSWSHSAFQLLLRAMLVPQ